MCCGNKRKQLIKEQQHFNSPVADNTTKMWVDVPFQYCGQSAITITGVITGKRYRFNQNGDVEIVDYRDVSSMMGINGLQKLSSK